MAKDVLVMSLSASLLQKISGATEHLQQITENYRAKAKSGINFQVTLE